MRKLLLWVLFFLIPFLYSVYLSAQPNKEKDCGTTCFSSEVISVQKTSETCTAYELKVSYSGPCSHALSHFAVAVPCGTIESISNSANWAQEVGVDPTTGLKGFKIDNIANFGEGSLESFTVRFTVCRSEDDCTGEMRCWQPQVAYKASTCVNYETLPVNCQSLKASLQKQDPSCFNTDDGSLSVVIEEGVAPYSYVWSNGLTTESISHLSAGKYSVVVRDQSGEEVILEETLSQPEEISLSGQALPATCNGVADGSIDLAISGSETPYSIKWNNGSVNEDLQQLSSGQYTVVVSDANNCSATATFTVGNTSTIDITASLVKPDCSESNGSIDISVTGGNAPYTFSWSDNTVSEDRSEIPAGIYAVVVTDKNGCSGSGSYFMKENNTLKLDATTTPAACTEDAGGSVDLTVVGGTAPYSYKWSNGEPDQDLADVGPGYYTVTVTDARNCTATHSYSVSRNTFQVPRTVQQPTCHDEENGSITLQEPIGGTGPFTYVWSRNNETGTTLTGLGEGIYSVTVTDATGCSRTLTSTINNPAEIMAATTVSTPGCDNDGLFSVDLSVTGGTAPYQFQWSDGSTSEDLSGVQSGTHTVVITDARGCSVTKEIIVEGGSAAWSCLITAPAVAPLCGSGNNTLSTPVADADSYFWSVVSSDGQWSISNADLPTVTFVAGGENSTATFTLTITKNGCIKTCSYILSSCGADNSGGDSDPGDDETGGEIPDGGNPDGQNPGDENDNGDDQNCDTCFETVARLVDITGECRTYELEVSTNGLCRHDLSHWTVALPCGNVSQYSNSEGWKMEFGKDPTTGLTGLKIDEISQFGNRADSFTVRFTVCATDGCSVSNTTVAYKAGQCVETALIDVSADGLSTAEAVAVYPNPFREIVNFEWHAARADVNLKIIDQYGNTLSQITSATGKTDGYYITLESTDLPKGMYYYRLTADGKTYQGKISKR